MATIIREPITRITNLQQYVKSRTARANTALVDGKIIYDGREWDEQSYNEVFPEPILQYEDRRLDSTQIPK